LDARPAKQPEQPPPQAPQQTYGYPPPPPGTPGQPQSGYPPPTPGYGAYPQRPVPDNGPAVAGFVLSLVSVGLLVISFGLSTIISLGLAIAGVICSRQGKRRVDAGETPKHRGLAQAGFVIGWVGVGLSILAIIGWAAAIILSAAEDESIFDPDTTQAVREAVGA
jgi:hypothetical protein